MVKSNLDAGCWCAVDEDPVIALLRRSVRGDTIVLVKCARTEVGWLYSLADDMCLADPRALFSWETDGDYVAGFLKSVDQTVDVW